MSYIKNDPDKIKSLVNKALDTYYNVYKENEPQYLDGIVSGVNIISYVKKNWITTKPEVDSKIFADWYPLNDGFIYLRLAKKGLLMYNDDENYANV